MFEFLKILKKFQCRHWRWRLHLFSSCLFKESSLREVVSGYYSNDNVRVVIPETTDQSEFSRLINFIAFTFSGTVLKFYTSVVLHIVLAPGFCIPSLLNEVN